LPFPAPNAIASQGDGRAGPGGCSPLLSEQVRGAGPPVPGAVGVPGQAAVGAGFAVELAAVQGELEQPVGAAHKQLLLLGQAERRQSVPPGWRPGLAGELSSLPCAEWGHWETRGVGGRACHPPGCPGRSPFPKCASPEAKGPRQCGWGSSQLPSVPCPLAALGRSRREDSPASVTASCPGWEKASGGEGEVQQCRSLLDAPACQWDWDPGVALADVPAPSSSRSMQAARAGPAQREQHRAALPSSVPSNLGSALPS